jgi:hypothetical protein
MNPYAARQPVGEGRDAAFGTGLPKLWRLAAVRIACHDFEVVTVHAEEGPRLLESIGDAPAVILRNHGLLSWDLRRPAPAGRSKAAAFLKMAQKAFGSCWSWHFATPWQV